MKILSLIAQYLMGLMFLVFGLNGFFHFIPQPPMEPGPALQYFIVMSQTHYLMPAFALQVVSGALFLANRFVPLALVLIAPVIVNILMFHALMAPKGIVPGIVVTVLWVIVFTRYRQAFADILRAKPKTN